MAEPRSMFLTKEKRKQYMNLFNDLDKDGNGWLSWEEVGAWLRGGGFKLSDRKIEKIFRIIDTNEDGKITLDEFYVAMEMINVPPEKNTNNLRKAFKAMDSNGDGVLSVEELHAGFRNAGYSLTEEQIENVAGRLAKTHKEGISFDEFLDFFKN